MARMETVETKALKVHKVLMAKKVTSETKVR